MKIFIHLIGFSSDLLGRLQSLKQLEKTEIEQSSQIIRLSSGLLSTTDELIEIVTQKL